MSAQGDFDWHVARCESGACVQVARHGEMVLIGKSGSPDSPVSEFTLDEWRNFIVSVKMGDFDVIEQ
jgi:uncharacterized protein DUF397